ncbi:lipoprotein [Spiroplasma endosymbiont of Crioceris asparagi]|uniref:lipoprotein n=1 Tax=Spiroplasma endosymbiont of Crioceris asparagi TaxID=3066286 RepID=UPI0030D2CC8E
MKKLIGLLGSLGLVAAAGVTVVSCGNKDKDKDENGLAKLLSNVKFDETSKLSDVKKEIIEIVGDANKDNIDVTSNHKAEADADKDVLAVGDVVTVTAKSDFDVMGGQDGKERLASVKKDETFNITILDSTKKVTAAEIKAVEAVTKIKDSAGIDDVNGKLKAVVDSNDYKDKLSSLTAVLKQDSQTDVVVAIETKGDYWISGDKTFELIGAIKKQEDKKITADAISQNNAIKAIKGLENLDAVNAALTAAIPNIDGVKSLTAVLDAKPTDVVVTIEAADGYTVDGVNTFKIIGAIKENKPTPEVKKITADAISQNNAIKAIKGLENLDAVNAALTAAIPNIDGVKSLTAVLDAKPTDVVVTIEAANGYTIDGVNTFKIIGAIKENKPTPEVKKITADAISQNNAIKAIKGLENLDAVNAALTAAIPNIDGVKSLTAVLDAKPTDVVVTIEAANGYTIDGVNTFKIIGAIKENKPTPEVKKITADAISQNNAIKAIKGLENLDAVNAALTAAIPNIDGVKSLTAVLDAKPTDVVVTIEAANGYTIDGVNTFKIIGAIKDSQPKPPANKDIAVDNDKATTVIKKTATITITNFPDLQNVVVASENEAIATVVPPTQDGTIVITGMAEGTTNITITASNANATKTIAVIVTKAPKTL